MSHRGRYPPQTMGLAGQPDLLPEPPEFLYHTTEPQLFKAYRHTRNGCVCCIPNPERCACGGMIAPDSVRGIEAAVSVHNRNPQHLAWRDEHF